MDVLMEYAAFLARTVTVVVAIAVVLGLIAAQRRSGQGKGHGRLTVSSLNEFYQTLQEQVEDSVLSKAALKVARKKAAKKAKLERKIGDARPRVFVLDFDGDIKASAVENLRQEISALLMLAEHQDEVVVRLESPGGMVHGYGLAASQLARIRQADIPLTVCVDKVAASGGYMMACIGNRILAAPFAVLGSIGVVAQLPNLHRFLQKHDVDYEVLTAGKYKRTLTVLGENTEQGRAKFLEDLEQTHQLFKGFVAKNRPQLDIEDIATGEVWLGQTALEKQLVDQLMTSDEYLLSRMKDADLYGLHYQEKKGLSERLGVSMGSVAERLLDRGLTRLNAMGLWRS